VRLQGKIPLDRSVIDAGATFGPEFRAALARIDERERRNATYDEEVREHEKRVGLLCAKLCLNARPDADAVAINRAYFAGRYHDIGKLDVPPDILFKRDRLDPEERLEVEAHTEHGKRLFGECDVDVPDFLADAAAWHHEAWDGSGYNGLAGDDIPEIARLVAVADVWDALTAKRCYKQALSEDAALRLVTRGEPDARCGITRHLFDPQVLKALVAIRIFSDDCSLSSEARLEMVAFLRGADEAARTQRWEFGQAPTEPHAPLWLGA
jgi:HD-GYP domain-containing protein (c-di-GMP phosphodiesterase class II)